MSQDRERPRLGQFKHSKLYLHVQIINDPIRRLFHSARQFVQLDPKRKNETFGATTHKQQ